MTLQFTINSIGCLRVFHDVHFKSDVLAVSNELNFAIHTMKVGSLIRIQL